MAKITSKIYGSRPYKNGDEEALINLYNTFTGRSRTLAEYQWEWLETSQGQGNIWIIEKKDTKEIVGHHGLIPIPLSYFGESMLMGKTENTLIDRQHQGKILYFMFEKQFFEEAKERFDLLYTTQGSGTPGRIRKRLGYVPIGTYETYIKIYHKSGLDYIITNFISKKIKHKQLANLIKWFFRFLNYSLILFLIRKRPIDKQVNLNKIDKIDKIEQDLDALWDKSKSQFGITIARTAKYLKWRIFDNPNVNYDFFAATKNNKLIGYVVIEYRGKHQADIIDLVAYNNNDLFLDTIIHKLIQQLSKNQISILRFYTLLSSNKLNVVLKRNGFIPRSTIKKLFKRSKPQEMHLLAKAFNININQKKVSNPENWYYTSIFTEGLLIPYQHE